MKVIFKNGRLHAIAETLADIQTLISLTENGAKISKGYKKQYRRNCPTCGKSVKGAKGLARHKSFCPKK